MFLIPPMAVFSGIGINYFIENYKNKKILLLLALVLFIATCILVIKQFPNSRMDTNQFKYGFAFLNSYEQQKGLADYVKATTNPTDEILVFGWEPSLYWMSERMPPKSLGFSFKERLFNWSYLERVLIKQNNLKRVIFLGDFVSLLSSNDFLFNEKKIHGASIYNVNTDVDPCYLILASKDKNESLCDIISTPIYKHTCYAKLNKNLDECYEINSLLGREECLFFVASEKQDLKICNLIKDEDLITFCTSRLKKEFNHTACNNFFTSYYNKNHASLRCLRYYATFKNDTRECDNLASIDDALFCKALVSPDKTYCEGIHDNRIRAYCMAYSTSDASYCLNKD
ncbi:MAG: hypothetical protein Q8O03_04960 [Nanoarchaeota archaeon]|nr:hypothetical protein [Nanoarchaeota archaeon]